MMLIRKNSASILVYLSARSKNFTVFSSPHFLTPLSLFTSGADDPPPQTPFITKFLINSVGLSSEEAAKASKSITHIKFPSQPDSVLDFFRKNGFTDSHIKRIVSLRSKLLCANVDSTLKLKFDALRKLGFTETQIIKLITANPFVLNYLKYCNVRPRVEFLRGFFGSNDDILKAFSNDTSLLSCDLEKKIKPNIAFLRECQISDERICSALTKDKRIIGRNLSSLRSVAMRVIKLGVPCESGMFYSAFRCLCNVDSDAVDAKTKFLGSLGFSKAEVVSMMSRHPAILNLSAKNLRETVDFLVKEGGCTLSYLSRHPSIMSLSLTRRLIPRNYVMQLIREKGLLKKELDLYYIVTISERNFLEKFICSFQKKNMPDLADVYLSATAGSS
ncbi:hypothetical protein KSP39_PZI020362 [Platanthera zijinensis]|uniref:Uncharacterized protein n=1 Tax=Platanthera zijinensis TaxID=2320716 RepID=A0AAP0B0S0_9ASPA